MMQVPEQVVAINKAGLNAALEIANLNLKCVERQFALSVGAARSFVDDCAVYAEAWMNGRDNPNFPANFYDSGLKKSLGFGSAYFATLMDAQRELAEVIEQGVSVLPKDIAAAAIESAAKTAHNAATGKTKKAA